MKTILFVVAIFIIYLVIVKKSLCGCSKEEKTSENFASLLDFLSVIRNKKVEDIEKDPKLKKIISDVQVALIKERNNYETERQTIEEAMILKIRKSKSESNKQYQVVDDSIFRDFSQLKTNTYDDVYAINNQRVNLRDDSFGKLYDVYPRLERKTENDLIEIEKLSNCEIPIKMNLIENNNYLSNSNDLLSFDINKVEMNRGMIYNKLHNLTKISWAKSKLSWYKQKIDLEIRFTFINPNDGKSTHIIFPVFLTETQTIESFRDTYYDNELPNFKTNFNEQSDKISSSMRTGVMYSALKQSNVVFPKNEEVLNKNNFLKNLENQNNKISGQMKYGMYKSILDTTLHNNVKIKSTKNNDFYTENEIKSSLKDSNLDKLELSNVSKNIDLSQINDTLKNINFNTITNELKKVKYFLHEAESLTNLDNLLTDPNLIPEYICCNSSITSSKLITMDLYLSQIKILNQKRFYYTSTVDGSLALITQPYPYNVTVGKAIYERLNKVNEMF
jgi:hypothetical protein